jgi:Zn-dependent protease with chaperone function
MPFLLLLFLTLACLKDDWRSWDWLEAPAISAALTWLGVVLWVGVAACAAHRVRWRLSRDPSRRDFIARRYSALRLYHLIGLFVLFSVSLYLLGWGCAVQRLGGPDAPLLFPGAELLVIAPFVAGLIGSWACFYDAERALHDTGPSYESENPYWPRGAYLGFHIRNNLALVFIPLTLLIIAKGVSRLFPEAGASWGPVTSMVAALSVFVCMPWIFRLVLGLRPMPPGPMRDRLLAVARRLNFRCSNILLWNTRGGVANAMVAGVVPWIRYVLLTDRLVTELSGEEVEAVFGHEVGHVKHHHLPYYVGFLVVSMTVLWMAMALLLPDMEHKQEYVRELAAFPMLGLVGAYIFVVFGFLSRRCERQADIYGCRAVSCGRPDCPGHDGDVPLVPRGKGLCATGIRTFIDALEKVARLNGISRDKPGFLQSWQHSTIARRVEFLQAMLGDASLEPRFQRKVLLVKSGLLLALGVMLALLVGVHGWN